MEAKTGTPPSHLDAQAAETIMALVVLVVANIPLMPPAVGSTFRAPAFVLEFVLTRLEALAAVNLSTWAGRLEFINSYVCNNTTSLSYLAREAYATPPPSPPVLLLPAETLDQAVEEAMAADQQALVKILQRTGIDLRNGSAILAYRSLEMIMSDVTVAAEGEKAILNRVSLPLWSAPCLSPQAARPDYRDRAQKDGRDFGLQGPGSRCEGKGTNRPMICSY